MSGQQPQIEMQCVSKRFNGTLALDSASFSLPPGEIVGLLGSNGAGKTTALRCLVGLLRPTDGRCLVCGIDPQVDAIAVRRVVGFSPDEPQFTPHLTGREILDFVTAIRNVDPMAAKERLARLIPSWNFEAELGVETRKYSLGARKKLALLLALELREKVRGLALIAPAPDFTQGLLQRRLNAAQVAALRTQGVIYPPSQYGAPMPLTMKLLEDGARHLLLGGEIAVTCPVRVLHGMQDPDVPWEHSLKLADCLESRDVRLVFVKDGDHRLSREADLALLEGVVGELV